MEQKQLQSLQKQMQEWLKMDRDVLVLCENYEMLDVEAKLLDLSEQGAFLHIQVRNVHAYVQELLSKHHLNLLSEAKQYIYAYKSCLNENLAYLRRENPNAKFLKALLNCFKILSDFDDLPDFSKVSDLSYEKFKDLERMYATFKQLKGKDVYGHEIYDLLRQCIKKDVYVVYLGTPVFSKRFNEMLKSLDGEYYVLDEVENEHVYGYKAGTIEEECSFVLEDIFNHCQKRQRYLNHVLYIPSDDYVMPLLQLAKTLNIPLSLEEVNHHPYVDAYIKYYLEHIQTINEADAKYLNTIYYLGEDNFEQLKDDEVKLRFASTCEEYEAIIHEHLSFLKQNTPPLVFEGVDEKISFKMFALIYYELCKTALKVKYAGFDLVQVRKYEEVLWACDYEYIYLMGQNEDVVPSKLKDGGLILHDELLYLYGKMTPLDYRNEIEKMAMNHALYKGKEVILTCRSGARDGSQFLPNLNFMQMAKLMLSPSLKKTTCAKASYDGKYASKKQRDLLNEIANQHFQPSPLGKYEAKALYRKEEWIYSPSELEMYNACPYRYFLRYGMRLKNPDNNSFALDMGSLMHAVLDSVSCLFKDTSVSELVERYHLDKKDSLDENIDTLVEYLVKRHWQGTFSTKLEELNFKQFNVKASNAIKVLLYMAGNSDFKLSYHEQNLSLKIEDDFNFKGRIDRGDVYQDFLAVIDYKSSKKEIDLDLAKLGFNIQMLLYLEMLARQKHLKKGAVLYFNTSSPKLSSKEKFILDLKKEEDVLKEYRLTGFICHDESHEVIHGLDHQCDKSLLFPMRHTKNGFVGKLLKEDAFSKLIEDVLAYLKGVERRCSDGEIYIKPAGSTESSVRMKVSSCPYCEYKDVCLKDPFYHQDWEVPYVKGGDRDE